MRCEHRREEHFAENSRGPCGELRGELCSGDASPDNPGNVNATCAKHKTAWMLARMKTGM